MCKNSLQIQYTNFHPEKKKIEEINVFGTLCTK